MDPLPALDIIGLEAVTALGPDLAAKRGVRAEVRTVSALGRSVRVRILRPPGKSTGAHVYIHGGGWTIGKARMDDALNAELAASAGVVVVSVEYRLIPKHAFKDGIDDCETAASAIPRETRHARSAQSSQRDPRV